VLALVVALVIAVPTGIIAAVRQDSPGDYILRIGSILGLAIPGFWLATLIVTLPAIWWGWSPLKFHYTAFAKDPYENILSMIFPAIVLGVSLSAITMRLTRSALLEVLRQDYIRTAWAKGLRESAVIVRHGLKNALIPVVTVVGFQLATLLGGTIIIEQIFLLPGVGSSTLLSISQRDYPQLQANILFLATAFVFINLLVDLSYGLLDPRIRYR
jgi:peptide/nickel transport system permease protein